MTEAVTFLVVFGVLSVLSMAAMVLVVRWALRRQLRIAPRQRSSVPLHWLAPLTPGARVHRRLRIAATSARLSALAAGPGSATAQLAAELEAHAALLEPRVLAAYYQRSSSGARREVERQVAHVEHLARRLAADAVSTLQHPALAGGPGDDLADLDERLDALAAARRDLSAIERDAGLRPPAAPA